MFGRHGFWHQDYQHADVSVRVLDGEGNNFHRQYTQDAEPIIDHNTAVRNETNGWLPDGSARKVGAIPVTIVHDWIRDWTIKGELVLGDPTYGPRLNHLLKEKLKDRDFAKFRTTEHV